MEGREGLGGGAIGEERYATHGTPSVAFELQQARVGLHDMQAALRYRSARFQGQARPFDVPTEDGITVVGDRIGSGTVALVFCHGFLGWHRKPRLVRFQEALARRFTVYGFDFRGHGWSEGLCAFGAREHLDVDAVARLAHADGFERVVTFGGSMGGIAVIRHAALLGDVDMVVAVSTPALWDGHESDAVRRLAWLTSSPWGRMALRVSGVRPAPSFTRVEDPMDLVGKIAPIPLVLVHGRDDHFFDEEQAWALYRAANPPKRLLLASHFGHAEDGYTDGFADQLGQIVEAAVW
jgi:pimeloyl-ACP methyl ester carboxylesterase